MSIGYNHIFMENYLEHLETVRTTFGPNQEDIPEHPEDASDLLFNRQEKLGKFVDFNLGA